MLDGLVAEHIAVVGVVLAREFRYSLQCGVVADIDSCLAFYTTFRGNKDNTISTLDTVNGCGRSVLQYGDCLYGRDVDGLNLTLDTIDEDERLSIHVPGSCAADVDTWVFLARLT